MFISEKIYEMYIQCWPEDPAFILIDNLDLIFYDNFTYTTSSRLYNMFISVLQYVKYEYTMSF